MSNTVTPALWEDLVLPNPGIASNKWRYTENDRNGTAKMIELLGAAIVIFGFFLLFGRIGPFPIENGVIFLVAFLGTLALALFLLPKVSKRVNAARAKKRDEYRAQNASIIIDALAQQGWKIRNKDAVKTLVTDDNPYMENADGVRYYARQIYIGPKEITIMLNLSDRKTEQAMEDARKEKRIAFEIGVYERKNGPMTPEAKEAFVAALNIAL